MLTRRNEKIKLKDLVEQFSDQSNQGGAVVGYHSLLNIRPSYQREFIYDDKKKKLLVDSVLHKYDIGKFIWSAPSLPTPHTANHIHLKKGHTNE